MYFSFFFAEFFLVFLLFLQMEIWLFSFSFLGYLLNFCVKFDFIFQIVDLWRENVYLLY
jgi:hypothetical protein